MKNYLFILSLLSLVMTVKTTTFDHTQNISPGSSSSGYEISADSIAPDQTGMRDLTSLELSKEMIPGWNVGNSLDAIGGETNWGNPMISQRLIDSVKAAGFNSVRVPVAWSKFTVDSTFTIDTEWMHRVEEVVNYILINDMYAIINIHWDGGWMQPTYARQDSVNNRLAIMWEQIAVHFRDYNDHLLFAGTNEVMVEENYGTPTTEYYTVQNSYNQAFVTTVRSTGGRNYYRFLLVQGFNTNIDYTNRFFVMPGDVVENKLMVEVHYYDPYNFTLNNDSNITQWGKNATNSQKTETLANESWADGQFQKMKTKFIDNEIGVVLGEYGVISRTNLGSEALNKEFEGYRKYYMEYITRSLVNHELVPIVWDNGYTGNYGLGLFDRSTGAQVYPDIIKTIVYASDTTNVLGIGMSEDNQLPSSFLLEQNYPNPFNPSANISYSLSKADHVTLYVYDTLGREVALVVYEVKSPGNYSVVFDTSNLAIGRQSLASGVYYYRMKVDEFTKQKR